MGIFIYCHVSKSTTREEWESVYKETLQLAKAFPLAERREVPVRGISTTCLVPTEEREARCGWSQKNLRTGWFADGDYETLGTAERYSMWQDLNAGYQFDEDAPDAMLSSVLDSVLGYDWNDARPDDCYSLWDAKTQGEPYHIYLLAVACLIAARLGRKAYVFGDITRGQCERAVRLANEHLDRPITTPDQCDRDRLLARVKNLPLAEVQMIQSFTHEYLGNKDADFGAYVRDAFSGQAWDEYWKKRLGAYRIPMRGFEDALQDYLLWGFDLEKMCSFVSFEDEDGSTHYEDFVKRIMDAKLHHRNKDCTDEIRIDQDDEEPYGIATLFAQFALGGARNKKVDRYIPLEKIASALTRAIGDYCQVNKLIEEYVQQESSQDPARLNGDVSNVDIDKVLEQDPSYVWNKIIRAKEKAYQKLYDEYDMVRQEDLPYYEAGDTMNPALMDVVVKSFAFYRSLIADDMFGELMAETPEERCKWLARVNQTLLIRDKDWEKIFDDIKDYPESFARYYPMVLVDANSEELRDMLRAFVTNDALYSYLLELEAGESS